MQLRLKPASIAFAFVAALAAVAPAGAATLRFSGGVNAPPTDFAGYMLDVYCVRPGPGAERDPSCRAIKNWAARNAGRDRAAWSPPPIVR